MLAFQSRALGLSLLLIAALTPAGARTFELQGGATTLQLSDELTQAAGQLGLTLAANTPATLNNGGASFPVSGGALDGSNGRGEVAHRGGLTLVKGATQVDLLELVIDTKGVTPSITALAVYNRNVFERVRFFELRPNQGLPLPLEPSSLALTLGNIDVKLTLEGAIALNLAFGVNAFAPGFPIGTASSALQTQLDFLTSFEVDPEKYKGLWFEYARTPNFFEDNTPVRDGEQFSACFNSTAEYTVAAPDRIELTNRCTREGERGTIFEESISGAALVQPNTGNRKLQVAFGGPFEQLLQRIFTGGGAPYWIYCLGPVNSNGFYDWAVVSDSLRAGIFVLTREQFISESLEDEILSCAEAEGLPVERLIFRQR